MHIVSQLFIPESSWQPDISVKTETTLKILFILQPTTHITVTENRGDSKYRNKECKERHNEE